MIRSLRAYTASCPAETVSQAVEAFRARLPFARVFGILFHSRIVRNIHDQLVSLRTEQRFFAT